RTSQKAADHAGSGTAVQRRRQRNAGQCQNGGRRSATTAGERDSGQRSPCLHPIQRAGAGRVEEDAAGTRSVVRDLVACAEESRRCGISRGPGRVSHDETNRGETPMTPLPLNDFVVIDLTAHRAGPTAVRQLADWGAQVIKIEPSGELVDATGSRRDGPDFQNLHRNKRAMTLNLKSNEGRAIFMKLAERADVIV